jgi:hypothetical protein
MFLISLSTRLTKSVDGGILLDVLQGAMFSLNPVGTRIIELLREPQDSLSLAAKISQEFAVSEETVRGDVEEFLATLAKQGLLAPKNDEPDSADGGL